MDQQEISSAEIFGIAKKWATEMQGLPLHTHSAIVEMVKVDMQHRQLAMQKAHQKAQEDQQERILRIKESEMERAQQAQSEKDAAAMRPT